MGGKLWVGSGANGMIPKRIGTGVHTWAQRIFPLLFGSCSCLCFRRRYDINSVKTSGQRSFHYPSPSAFSCPPLALLSVCIIVILRGYMPSVARRPRSFPCALFGSQWRKSVLYLDQQKCAGEQQDAYTHLGTYLKNGRY